MFIRRPAAEKSIGTGRIPLRGTKLLFFVVNEGLRRGHSFFRAAPKAWMPLSAKQQQWDECDFPARP
jgi:hypothetical protein